MDTHSRPIQPRTVRTIATLTPSPSRSRSSSASPAPGYRRYRPDIISTFPAPQVLSPPLTTISPLATPFERDGLSLTQFGAGVEVAPMLERGRVRERDSGREEEVEVETKSHVVMKFGGTSVAKHLSVIVDTITPMLHIPNKRTPILVCSAQSYTVKTEGTTQRLLAAIDIALSSPTSNRPLEPQSDSHSSSISKSTKKPAAKDTAEVPMTPPPTPPQCASPTTAALHMALPLVYEENANPQPSACTIIREILDRHLAGAKSIVLRGFDADSEQKIFAQLEKDLRRDCAKVVKILEAVEIIGEISPRTRDSVVSVGELMACRTVVAALHSRNIPARLANLTDLPIPSSDSKAPLNEAFFANLVTTIRNRIFSLSSVPTGDTAPILVATGFFGPIPGSLLDQIGRGYTDVCAALCARAVRADELQIWKEVDGVFSADPRKILTARLLPEISRHVSKHPSFPSHVPRFSPPYPHSTYVLTQETFEQQAKLLTSYGSEVVHHLAIDQIAYLDIPMVVKNVVNPSSSGTRIVSSSSQTPYDSGVSNVQFPTPPAFAVTLLHDLEMVHVHFADASSSGQHPLSHVMDIIKEQPRTVVGLDLVSSAQGDICFMIQGAKGHSRGGDSGLFDALERVAVVTTSMGMSYLQIVFMLPYRSLTIACKALEALADAGVDVKMISQGPMESGVGCVISESEAAKAASVVHDALLSLTW
ncbi:putative aspartokinase [Hypsizygus marmoreus]|uniref:aspartate kinase n=1 Tax=Hypsizygus marmoreus TaxID=39966 RepID=A0A369K7B2_HYPMA|nr:putative aspartokinase [Hypsizygus marmoreus]